MPRASSRSAAGVTLNAAELAEMLQFLADWLQRDPGRLGALLEDFGGHPACNSSQLREDLDRFAFLLGGTASASFVLSLRAAGASR
jgi:hypothetical protein